MSVLDANIFGKNLYKVTTSDVREFCDKGIKEGINLDYKLRVSRSLSKTIAAMANTLGGWIFIGVEDTDDKPKAPYTGIKFEESLHLKITNLVIDTISPPILPIIHVCPADKENNTFIILYVPQSSEGPHWLFNQNKLPVRLSDRTSSGKWEGLASSNEWEYLVNKRKQSEKLFNEIYMTLDDLFVSYDDASREENYYSSGMYAIPDRTSMRVKGSIADDEKINILVSPKYPHTKLFKVIDNVDLVHQLRIEDKYSHGFFPFMHNDFKLYQYGLHNYSASASRDFISFFAIDEYGMIFFREKITEHFKDNIVIDLEKVLVRYKQTLLFAKLFYEKFEYYGELEIKIVIEGEEWMGLKMSESANFHEDLLSPLSTIVHKTNSQLQMLSNEKYINKKVADLYDDVANAFRWDIVRRRDLNSILSKFGL